MNRKGPIDLDQRRRVMERAQQIGHCVCNLKKACPCGILREKNVCICAGESPETSDEQPSSDKA